MSNESGSQEAEHKPEANENYVFVHQELGYKSERVLINICLLHMNFFNSSKL